MACVFLRDVLFHVGISIFLVFMQQKFHCYSLISFFFGLLVTRLYTLLHSALFPKFGCIGAIMLRLSFNGIVQKLFI